MPRPSVAFVGADGALGEALVPALGARAVRLRCPDLASLGPLAEVADADVVVDAAGPRVHPGLRWSDYLREHVGTALRVATSMRPGAHLVLVSSASVYGSGRGEVTGSTPPQPGSYPVAAYAWAKLAAEHAARAVCAERRVALTILRPSIVYGPGAGGALIKLRDLASRGLRVNLAPASWRQHLLHVDLLRAVLETLVARKAPDRITTYAVADPFVLTTAEVNAALVAAGPRAATIPFPLGLAAGAVRAWQDRSERQPPGPVAVAAMLAVDNAYDWRPCLGDLGIDPAAHGRAKFDAFIAPAGSGGGDPRG